MPACARKEIVLEGQIGVYHIWTRCVRRSFLCGFDQVTQQDFEHRRTWIRDYLPRLCQLFAVDAGFHVEMKNHLHLLLRSRPDVAGSWSDEEVVCKWKTIHRLVHSRDGRTITPVSDEETALELARPGRVEQLRAHLASVSQFMKALCEHIARRANKEDQVSGAFFESRFKCRRIENEAGILVCGIYIDLNQIRAGEALTPEASTHTSAYDRISARQQRLAQKRLTTARGSTAGADAWLCKLTLDQRAEAYRGAPPSATGLRASDKGLLPIQLDDYLQLLDWTGRQWKAGEKGRIPNQFAPILERLDINGGMWMELVTKFDRLFGHVVGQAQQLVDSAARAGRRCYRGRALCADAFG